MTPSPEQLLRVPHVDSSYGFEISPDGRRLAFEISEDLPPNWREAIPVVLEELAR